MDMGVLGTACRSAGTGSPCIEHQSVYRCDDLFIVSANKMCFYMCTAHIHLPHSMSVTTAVSGTELVLMFPASSVWHITVPSGDDNIHQ